MTCQSRRQPPVCAVDERVAHVRVTVRDRPAPTRRVCGQVAVRVDQALRRAGAVGHAGAVGPVEVGADLLQATHVQDELQPRLQRRVAGDDLGLLPAVGVQLRELAELIGDAFDGAVVERVAEHRAGLHRVLA